MWPAAGASVRLFAHLAVRRGGMRRSLIHGSAGWISKVLVFYLRGSGFGDPVNPCEMGTPIWQEDLVCAIMNCVFSLSAPSCLLPKPMAIRLKRCPVLSFWTCQSRGVLYCLYGRVNGLMLFL